MLTREINSDPSDVGADSKMNESTESIESGLVGFHFSPPAMLLKPVPRNSPLCLETSSETIEGKFLTVFKYIPLAKTPLVSTVSVVYWILLMVSWRE